MIRLLIITKCMPYPLTLGGNISQFSILEKLQHFCKITLCYEIYSNDDLDNSNKLNVLLPLVEIIPIFSYDQANIQPNDLINYKQKTLINRFFDLSIRKVYKKLAKKKPQVHRKNNINIIDEFSKLYFSPKTKEFINSVTELLNEKRWDLVQIEFYEYLDLIYLIDNSYKTIYVNHESRTLRFESKYLNNVNSGIFEKYNISLLSSYEGDLLRKFDNVFVFSDIDNMMLRNIFNCKNVFTTPFPILDSHFTKNNLFKKLDKLTFIGSSKHLPNKEGLEWFANEIYPAIKEKFNLKVYVIGDWPLHNQLKVFQDDFVYLGVLDNYDDILENSAMIVPILSGNGIRTKILYGLAKGVPVISTRLGAEGILTDELFLADNKIEFIYSLNYLLSLNIESLSILLNNARQFVEFNYSQSKVVNQRLNIYKQLLN